MAVAARTHDGWRVTGSAVCSRPAGTRAYEGTAPNPLAATTRADHAGTGYDGTAEELYASAAPMLKRGYAYSSMSVTMVAPDPGVRDTCT